MRWDDDWDVVRLDDWVPGEPAGILELGNKLSSRAELIDQVKDDLWQIGEGGDKWDSSAGEEFLDVVDEIPESLLMLSHRYERTSDALATFAEDLRVAQTDAESAIRQGMDAEDIYRAAVREIDQAESESRWCGTHEDCAPRDHAWGNPWRDEMVSANDMRTSLTLLEQARDIYEQAERTCEDVIDDAIDDGLANRWGLLGDLGNLVHDVGSSIAGLASRAASWVWDNIETIASVIAVVAVVAMILASGPFGFALAGAVLPFLMTAATVTTGLSAAHRLQRYDELSGWERAGLALDIFTVGIAAGATRGGQALLRGGSSALQGLRSTSAAASAARRLSLVGTQLRAGVPLSVSTRGLMLMDTLRPLASTVRTTGSTITRSPAAQRVFDLLADPNTGLVQFQDALNNAGDLSDVWRTLDATGSVVSDLKLFADMPANLNVIHSEVQGLLAR